MDKKIDDLNRVIDKQEQYSRRNCILLHGMKESENEDTDAVVTETLNELLQEKLTDIDIDRSHQQTIKAYHHQVCQRYNIRNRVFKNKKQLKDTGVSITKSLTQKRMKWLLKLKFLFKNIWLQDGKILVKSDDNTIKV